MWGAGVPSGGRVFGRGAGEAEYYFNDQEDRCLKR